MNTKNYNRAKEELRERLNEKMKTEWDENVLFFAGLEATRFMEDNIGIAENPNELMDWEYVDKSVTDVVDELMITKDGIISLEIWGKQIIDMSPNLYSYLREVVDDIAGKYNLLKVYKWGSDDGGEVIFSDNKNALITSYYGRGEVSLNQFGPKTEDEYWAPLTSEDYDEVGGIG